MFIASERKQERLRGSEGSCVLRSILPWNTLLWPSSENPNWPLILTREREWNETAVTRSEVAALIRRKICCQNFLANGGCCSWFTRCRTDSQTDGVWFLVSIFYRQGLTEFVPLELNTRLLCNIWSSWSEKIRRLKVPKWKSVASSDETYDYLVIV